MSLPRVLFGILVVCVFSLFVYVLMSFIQPQQAERWDGGNVAPGREPPQASQEAVAEAPVTAPTDDIAMGAPAEELAAEAPMPEAIIMEDDAVLAEPIIVPAEDSGLPYHIVKLFFATNRVVVDAPFDAPAADKFSAEDGDLSYGTAEVSIPKDHQIGHLESQGWFSAMFFEPNPEKHVILMRMDVEDQGDVFEQFRTEMNLTSRDVLFYIHGYNTGVDTAARRAGQLTHDLDWTGPSFFYSWPSQDSTKDYGHDQEKARGSRRELRRVFEDIAETEAERIVVIAHSMGTDLLTQTLELMSVARSPALQKIQTVILAAPDINAQNFQSDIVPVFAAMKEDNTNFTVTLYASKEDSALQVSEVVNGVERIGRVPRPDEDRRAALSPVQIVDATGATTNFFGHTYINDNPSVIRDVFCLINKSPQPAKRLTLEGVPNPEGPEFRIRLTPISTSDDATEESEQVDSPTAGPKFSCG